MMAVSQVYRLVCLLVLSMNLVSLPSMANYLDNPLFYQIDYKGKKAYILGSIHIGKADFYPLPLQVEKAFAKSSGLVVEAKPDQSDIPQLMQEFGRQQYPSEKTTQALLASYCQDKQAFCHQMSQFSPWVQAMQISLMRFSAMGLAGEHGVDVTLMRQNGNRPLYELESTEAQLRLLASFSARVQWQMLQESINTSDEDMLLLVDAWRQGNEPLLVELIEGQLLESSANKKIEMVKDKSVSEGGIALAKLKSSENNSTLINRLLWQRNQTMAQGIKRLLDSNDIDNLFVVVGVGHLVGEKNIQSVLLKQGATITNCWKQKCL